MKNLFVALGFISLLSLGACKRDDLTTLGPAICPEASFRILGSAVIPDTVNFTVNTKKLSIRDTLSQVTPSPWILTINGLSSKAKKVYTGTSAIVNVDWYGEPGSNVFFTAEDCNVTLEIPCLGVVYSKSFKITATSDFSEISYLMWNFEKSTTALSVFGDVDWTSFGLFNFPDKPAKITPSPQGGGYFNFTGTGVDNEKVWYFGSLNGAAGGAALSSTVVKAIVAKTSSDASRVYFNCFINTNGKSSSQVFFQLKERVGTVVQTKTIGFAGNFEGWKYISFKLSDIGIQNVSNLRNFDIYFQAYPEQARECEVNMDMPIFTLDKPFLDN